MLSAISACAGMSPAMRHPSLRPHVALRPAERHPAPQLCAPRGLDEKLVAADVTLIFAFSFARTLGTILTSPTFPGWLAPITADPVRLGTTIQFASLWTVFWVLASTFTGAFDPGIDAQARSNVGPVSAGKTFALATALYAAACTGVSIFSEFQPPALQLDLNNVEGALGLGLSLAAWRAVLQETIPR